jgi:hypothetical protein
MGVLTGPPSGLFPTGPPRPAYREPHPVRATGVLAGTAAGAGWLALFALLGAALPGHVWWVLAAAAAAWVVALVLARHGDRGVAVGLAAVTGVGGSMALGLVAGSWAASGDWPLW